MRIRGEPFDSGAHPRELEVLWYGESAFKQAQQLMKLAYIFSVGLHVEAVTNLDGFNEVAISPGNANLAVSPIRPAAPEWMRFATDRTADPESVRLANQMYSWKQESRAAALDRVLCPN